MLLQHDDSTINIVLVLSYRLCSLSQCYRKCCELRMFCLLCVLFVCHCTYTMYLRINDDEDVVYCWLSAVMRATATVKKPNADQESVIVQEIRRLLNDCTEEDLNVVDELVQLRRQGMELVGASNGSVDVLFWCRSKNGLVRLHEWLVNGRISDIIKVLINRLMKRSSPEERISIDLEWSEREYDLCVKYFNRFVSGL